MSAFIRCALNWIHTLLYAKFSAVWGIYCLKDRGFSKT